MDFEQLVKKKKKSDLEEIAEDSQPPKFPATHTHARTHAYTHTHIIIIII